MMIMCNERTETRYVSFFQFRCYYIAVLCSSTNYDRRSVLFSNRTYLSHSFQIQIFNFRVFDTFDLYTMHRSYIK